MRGRHEEQEVMLAYVNLEERVPKDHPLRTIKTVADEGAETSLTRVRQDVLQGGAGLGATGAIAESVTAHLPLLGAQRASLLRRAGIQSPLPLVFGHEPDGA